MIRAGGCRSPRRLAARCLGWLLAAAAVAPPLAARGQEAPHRWPGRPVRLIVPFPVGAAPDVIARLVGDRLAQKWGQAVVVENRAGAGGIPGMSALARSDADGYTLGFVPAAVATLTPQLYKDPQFDMNRELVPLAMVGTSPMMVVVSRSSPVRTLAELVDRARSNAGKVNFAAAQTNSVPHLTGEMLSVDAGMHLYTVPYSGSPAATTAVLAGEADVTIDGLPALAPNVKAGKLRALAVTSSQRLPGFEDVPTVAETVPGFESVGWFGIFAPAGTPAAVVARVNRDTNELMRSPDLVARLSDLGVYPDPGTPADLGKYLVAQQDIWKRAVRRLGLQAQ